MNSYWSDKLKIWSGCILFVYVTTHFLNHSLGLFSIELMERARDVFVGFWRSPPLNYLVVVSLLLHGVFSTTKMLRRKSFHGLTAKEWAQIVIGLFTSVVLIGHVMFTKGAHEIYGIEDTYSYVLLNYTPEDVVIYFFLIFGVWFHGVVGIDGVLSTKRWYPPWRNRLTIPAYVFPALAMAGFLSAHKQMHLRNALDPGFASRTLPSVVDQGRPFQEWALAYQEKIMQVALGCGALILAAFALRYALVWSRRRRNSVSVQYPDGSAVNIAPGTSVLEASLMGRIPHVHLCGGRGRCSTCRVRIYTGGDEMAPPGPTEQRVLRQIGAAENVRLACQTYPVADCRVYPILPAETQLRNYADARYLQGSDRKIAILFADLRGFTSFAEHRLPFDVVFVLNQYFQAVGRSIEARGGYLDKFIGDGAMALFGLEENLKTACRHAIEAAWEMGRELEQLNLRLSDELPQPLKIGIGLHCGDAIVAKMGYKHTNHLTAIGDAVNTASRLEAMTKDFGAQLMISEEAASLAGLELSAFETTPVAIRGRTTAMRAFIIPLVQDLPVGEAPVTANASPRASV